MKTSRIILFLTICLSAILFTSCHIEKRLYRNGFYIASKHDKSGRTDQGTQTLLQPETSSAVVIVAEEVALQNENTHENSQVVLEQRTLGLPDSRIDGVTEVKSGTKVETMTNGKTQQRLHHWGEAQTANPDGSEGGKSQMVALLLCIFFGLLGIHRFYLGYIGIGVIQLLTAGGCGIWALIDLIMIITGDLKPKNGDYGTKF